MPIDEQPEITCAHCGERIGVYEPIRLELADGSVGSSSYLNLAVAELRARRLWHPWCFAEARAGLDG